MSKADLCLRNLIGFTHGGDRFHANDAWHFLRHCLMPWGDMPEVMTVDQYFEMAREVARKAADGLPGTFIKVRENGDVLVYWEPKHRQPGLFMVIVPEPRGGKVKTLFRPRDGKAYFDEQITPTLH